MKNSVLLTLLVRTRLIYKREKEIGQHFLELQRNLPEGIRLSSLSHDREENKTQCERLEGLIEIITINLRRELSTADVENYFQYCSQMLQRFIFKHAAHSYKNVIRSPDVTEGSIIVKSPESVRHEAFEFPG